MTKTKGENHSVFLFLDKNNLSIFGDRFAIVGVPNNEED